MRRVHRSLLTAGFVAAVGAAGGYYAWVEGYTASAAKRAQDAEDKRLFSFGPARVLRGTLVARDTKMGFHHDEAEGWILDTPRIWPADTEALVAAITRMAAIKNDAIAVEDASAAQLTQYGFDKPSASMQVELKDGSKHALLIGAENKLHKAYFITNGAKKTIGLAADSFYWAFDRDLFAYRAKEIFRTEVNAIDSITVSTDGALAYGLRKVDGRWRVDTPKGQTHDADPAVVGRFLLILTRDLKAESFATDALDPSDPKMMARYGLDTPAHEIAVTTASGRSMRALVGRTGEDLTAGGPFLQLADTTTVIGVYEAFPADLGKTADHFRDRTISSYDSSAVRKLAFEFPQGPKAVVQRADDGEWRLTAPKQAAAKAWTMSGLITRLSKLRSTRTHVEKATLAQTKEWMLEPPRSRVTVYGEGDEVLADIRLGKRLDETHYFIGATGLDRVDVVELGVIAFLPASADGLVDTEKQ